MRHFFFDRYQSHKKYLAKLAAAAGVAAALVAGTAQATSIPIGNPGFETHPTNHNFGNVGEATPWIGTGYWQGNAGYANRAHSGNGSGFVDMVASGDTFIGETITQTLGTTWTVGIYKLDGWVSTISAGNIPNLDVTSALLNGNNSFSLGSIQSVPPATSTYVPMDTLTVVVNPGDPNIGSPIEISFTASGATAIQQHRTIDDITLTLVPEPGSLVLLGMGAAGLGLMARRRFRKSTRQN